MKDESTINLMTINVKHVKDATDAIHAILTTLQKIQDSRDILHEYESPDPQLYPELADITITGLINAIKHVNANIFEYSLELQNGIEALR